MFRGGVFRRHNHAHRAFMSAKRAMISMPMMSTSAKGPVLHRDNLRVLVVDDEASVAFFLARILRPWHVTVASDGHAALRQITENAWDVILCDYSLPGMDGADLYAAASPDQRHRFLFMTGGAFTAESEAFLDSCHEPPLYKPFDPVELRGRIRDLVDRLDGPQSA
ncbi:MAG: response regulator [Deltaproteobacteria bacterium]|nr:MAG: response regulator [Deltaproteobacteria bacterium]